MIRREADPIHPFECEPDFASSLPQENKTDCTETRRLASPSADDSPIRPLRPEFPPLMGHPASRDGQWAMLGEWFIGDESKDSFADVGSATRRTLSIRFSYTRAGLGYPDRKGQPDGNSEPQDSGIFETAPLPATHIRDAYLTQHSFHRIL